ncbi:hypothetical protein C8R43DRAFT_1018194 [Mycena crocata]|nr:hypothetical protein C8R43DRAFT_1018194 [Mycena crocata]
MSAHNSPPPTTHTLDSPPSSPPSPANSDTDTKLSRKREREVSLEPATTPKSATDTDPLVQYKDARTPAKKNRLHLDSTAEEEDGVITRSRSPSPVDVSVSPPQEMKMRVRQISQGVEDLSWQNMQQATPEKTSALAPFVDAQLEDSAIESADGSTEIKVDEEEPPSSDGAIDIHSTEDAIRSTSEPSSQVSVGMPSRRDSDSDSGEKEKGLKRKFLERGTSAGPPENGDEPKAPAEPLKRFRDDPDRDENPRETKRPSPPPEPNARTSPPPAATPKLSGFMAYASTSSPFASVKGQNLFAKKATSSIPSAAAAGAPVNPVVSSPFTAALGEPSSPPPSTKRAVFGSSSSPFAASTKAKQDVLGSAAKFGRAKSPTRRTNAAGSSAFSAYASGGAHGFSLPAQKRVRSGSPDDSGASSLERATPVGTAFGNGSADSGAEDERDDRPVTFGEKLRAGKDEEEEGKSDEEGAKPVLTEQEFTTGEEEEETLHQVRGKLYSLVDGAQWKERGTGTLKLNVRRSDGGGARLVMRKEAVYTVLLNVTLFHGMRCTLAQDPRYLRLSVLEGGVATHYNLRVGSAKAAQELMNEINANLPTA